MVQVHYTCSGCGCEIPESELPFKPKDDRAIFCRSCYENGAASQRPHRKNGRARKAATQAALRGVVADVVSHVAPAVQVPAPVAQRMVPDSTGRAHIDLDNLDQSDLDLVYEIMLAIYRWRDGR